MTQEGIRVVRDFLPPRAFARLSNMVSSPAFPMFFQPTSAGTYDAPADDCFMFTHSLFHDGESLSGYTDHFEPVLDILWSHQPFGRLLKMKLNCYTNRGVSHTLAEHVDLDMAGRWWTAVLHLNENDGETIVGDQRVRSVANQLVLFDGSTPHSGTTQTDTDRRLLLNINVEAMPDTPPVG